MPTPVGILTMLRQILSQASSLDYVSRVQIGLEPGPNSACSHLIRLCPSDIRTDPETWPEEAALVVILYASVRCSDPCRAYYDPDRVTVLDMFEDIRLVLHDNDPLPGILGMFMSSAKFDIKKHSWGSSDRLDVTPLYQCEVYLTIRYQTVLPS